MKYRPLLIAVCCGVVWSSMSYAQPLNIPTQAQPYLGYPAPYPAYPALYPPYPFDRGTTVIRERERVDPVEKFLWGGTGKVREKTIQTVPNAYWGVPQLYPRPQYVPHIAPYPYDY